MSDFKYSSLGGAVKAEDDSELKKMLASDRIVFKSEEDEKEILGSLLFHAAEATNVNCMRVLLESGASPNYIDRATAQPVMFKAVTYNNEDGFKLLLEKGADINHTDTDGNNIAVKWLRNQDEVPPNEDGHFHYEVVKIALDYGLEVNEVNLSQRNLLHEAAMIVESLHGFGLLTEKTAVDLECMMDRMVLAGCDLNQNDIDMRSPSQYIPEDENIKSLDAMFEHFEDLRLGDKVITLSDIENKENQNKAGEDKNDEPKNKTVKMRM